MLLGRRARPEEVAVVAALLADQPGLLEQLTSSTVVRRSRPARDRFVLTLDHITVEPPYLGRAVETDWLRLQDISGEPLEFRLRIHRSGIFDRLEGRAPGGRWPRRWRVADVTGVTPIELPELPKSSVCLERLRAWLDLEPTATGKRVLCLEPADAGTLDALEQREGAPLPARYREFAMVSDGLEVGGRMIFGTLDAYVTDIEGAAWWILGDVDAHLVARPGEDAIYAWVHDERGPERVADDLAVYVRRVVFGL